MRLYILILFNLHRPSTMLWFLFTAIYVILYLIPTAMAQASNLSSADLTLIQSVANTTIVKVDAKGQSHFPHNCDSPCKFLRHNATTGGDCFTLFMTTPTCLYFPFPLHLTDSQCLTIPKHMNSTLLGEVIAALGECRNGTTGSFSPLNVTVQDPPSIAPSNSTNSTLERRATDTTSSVTWPCPTVLYVGRSSSVRNSDFSLKILIGAVFMGCMGVIYGMGC